MSSERANETEFAVGIILACVGGLLLYTQYHRGYWGILALGIIFIIKNWPHNTPKGRGGGDGIGKGRGSDKIYNSRLNR